VAGQPVHVAEYGPAWPDRFAEQQDRAATILAPWLAARQLWLVLLRDPAAVAVEPWPATGALCNRLVLNVAVSVS
jgi:hypothetical protein